MINGVVNYPQQPPEADGPKVGFGSVLEHHQPNHYKVHFETTNKHFYNAPTDKKTPGDVIEEFKKT